MLLGHIFSYLHFVEVEFSTIRWLKHFWHIAWLPAEGFDGYGVDYTARSRRHPLLLTQGHDILGFSEVGALRLGRCGGMFCFLGALTKVMLGFTVGKQLCSGLRVFKKMTCHIFLVFKS